MLYRQARYNQSSDEELYDIRRKISVNFQKYVQENWVENPVYVKIVQQVQKDMNQGENNKNNVTDSRILFKVKLKPIVQPFLYSSQKSSISPTMQVNSKTTPLQKQPSTSTSIPTSNSISSHAPTSTPQILQFTIQINTTQSQISIKYHTPITLQPSTTDILIQKWNTLVFQSQYLSLQLGQKIQMIQKRKKYLILKLSSSYQVHQSIITKCVKLIDITIAAYKVIQQQFNKGRQSQGAYTYFKMQQLEEIGKKVKHYTNVVSQVNRKVFINLQSMI